MKKKTARHVYNVNRAIVSITHALDRFELTCVKNGLRVKRVVYGPEKSGEFSGVKFKFTEIR